MDPVEHYLLFGSRLNRIPSPRFAANSGLSPLLDALALHRNFSQNFSAHISFSSIKDFKLDIEGWARDNLRPGLPVRLDLLVDDDAIATILCRTTSALLNGEDTAPEGAHLFKLSHVVRPKDVGRRFRLRFEDGSVLAFHPRHHDDSASWTLDTMAEPSVPIGSDDVIWGNVERSEEDRVKGWALCKTNHEATVDLILHVDGVPFSHVRCTQWRGDVKAKHGGHGFHGFTFEIPSNMAVAEPVHLSVRPAVGASKIRNPDFTLKPKAGLIYQARLQSDHRYLVRVEAPKPTDVSIVILNRNGAQLLKELFASARAVEDLDRIEWIIVDHNSDDNSESICHLAREAGLDVSFINRHSNFSFSDSNNYGARLAKSDLLLFVNNDIVFREGVIEDILTCFSDPRVGIVGLKLTDYIESGLWSGFSPIQHLGVYFIPRIVKGWFRPFEARSVSETDPGRTALVAVPAVTGAFMAMRKSDFLAVDGFGDQYFYGLEDVDLCLKAQARLSKAVVCLNWVSAAHHRGFSREKDTDSALRRRDNNKHFTQEWSSYLRRMARTEVLTKPGFWVGRRPVVGFVVKETGDNTSAGEFYTAYELGRALQELAPVHLRFLPRNEWDDLTEIDILIVMVNDFDIGAAKAASPFLITINWARQWFDRWSEDRSIHAYDYVWASSRQAADFLSAKTGREVHVVPIASNTDHFSSGVPDPDFECDYCFTGSRFGLPREIEFALVPSEIEGKGVIFGHNWEETPFGAISKGPVAYSRMNDVYASTRIVLDDANIATKPWGSCNSRVFDALAAGCLVITNGALGSRELFGDLVPTYHDAASLTETLNYWLKHENERKERVAVLQKIVCQQHSYRRRAELAVRILSTPLRRWRISIKSAAKKSEESEWGDFHFATSLAMALRAEGHIVRVDSREDWNCGIADADDVVIVLRGLLAYEPKRHQKNIIWVISHPNDVSITELMKYDHVYVASQLHASMLADVCDAPVEAFLQCVDTKHFVFDAEVLAARSSRGVFVGNSRGVFRDAVRWSVERNLEVDIYGAGWEPFIPSSRLNGQSVPNSALGEVYATSRLVLCDHWPDMKRLGYISNRVFDVLAVGGELAVDDVAGLKDLLPNGAYHVFDSADDLERLVRQDRAIDIEKKRKLANWVAKEHSFAARARALLAKVEELMDECPGGLAEAQQCHSGPSSLPTTDGQYTNGSTISPPMSATSPVS